MAYDGDKAGRAAALKASRLLSIGGFSGGVVIFSDGQDPADMVKKGSVEELSAMFRKPRPFIEFVLDEILAFYNLLDPKAKESALQEATAYLKTLSPLLQEEYKSYLASRLGLSPSFVKIAGAANINHNKAIIDKSRHKDMWELTLIKTVLENPSFIDQILDVLDPSLLQFHSEEFALALKGEVAHPALMAILVDEQIKALQSEEALKAELIAFLMKHYEREYKKVNAQTEMNFEQKAFHIRKLRGVITQLKKGVLVPFKS